MGRTGWAVVRATVVAGVVVVVVVVVGVCSETCRPGQLCEALHAAPAERAMLTISSSLPAIRANK